MCTVLLPTKIVVECMFLWGGQQRKRNRGRQENSDAIDAMPESLPESLSAKLFVAPASRM